MKRPTLSPTDARRATYLGRLQRLVRLRRELRNDLNVLGLRLLERSIEATYRDCCELGDEAIVAPIMAAYGAQR